VMALAEVPQGCSSKVLTLCGVDVSPDETRSGLSEGVGVE